MSLLVKSFKAPMPLLAAAVVTSRRCNSNVSDVTFQTKGYKLHKLEQGPSTTVSLNRADALHYYKQMQLIRLTESAAGDLCKEGGIICHLYSGQEACAVGMKSAMDEEDAVITAYRCHGFSLLHGSTAADVLSELTGRISGNVHGKGGSMHLYEKNFYGGNGIVGSQQPLGTGIAFAMKYRDQKNVCLTLYGDGAANQGQLYESTNMAYLWKLPVLYICENNGFGKWTRSERSSASTDYYTRGDYVPGVCVDGMDVLAVREAIRWSKEYCDAGKGPLMLELKTYRYSGHTMSGPGIRYRTPEEIHEVRKTCDPIACLKGRIISSGLAAEEDLSAIDNDVRKEVDEAVKIANTAGLLPVEGVYSDIYHNTPPQMVRGVTIESSRVQKFVRTEELVNSLNV